MTLSELVGTHPGGRAVIMGNGLSLLASLPTVKKRREEGWAIFGSNRVHLSGLTPAYLAVTDPLLAQDRRREIRVQPGVIFLDEKHQEFQPADFPAVWLTVDREWTAGRTKTLGFWADDVPDRVFGGGTVTYALLQIAFAMGFSDVRLVGMDHRYTLKGARHLTGWVYESTVPDPNHFHPDYFGPGQRFHDPQVDRMAKAYVVAKAAYEEAGRKVWNCTAGGELEVFERRPL
jgi:hypothetical protein